MELREQSPVPVPGTQGLSKAANGPAPMRKSASLRARDVQIYLVCEVLTELLIYLMVLFSPWAFGTTQPWSVWVMNSAGYLLGAMLALKLAIRRLKHYRPPRWDEWDIREPSAVPPAAVSSSGSVVRGRSRLTPSRLTATLAVLTVAILAYCLVSALNARATYDPNTLSFAYRDRYIRWLPHSFDSNRTWFALWTCLGLACSFWAIRDWLLGKSAAEERPERRANGPGGKPDAEFFPARLRRLLWVLAINGGLLGLEGIIQRIEGSGKLLFLVRPAIHHTAATQFGPYAYYANASQYFNLLWPACLGFWWLLHRSSGLKRHRHHWVLVCCAIMAACPIISTSRGGAIITVAILALATLFLATTHFLLDTSREERSSRLITLALLAIFFVGALGLGAALGWKALKPRMATIYSGFQGRERDYDRARPMAADYPVFGTGPGTFETVSQLYRVSTRANWYVQLHNDWLETRITFGWVGSVLIALALATVVLRWFVAGGIHSGRRFIALMWLALAGCLVHARFDFPFQIHSIVFLFLVLCALLFNLSRRPSAH